MWPCVWGCCITILCQSFHIDPGENWLLVSITTVQPMICAHNWLHYGLNVGMSNSFVCTLRYPIAIDMQICLNALNIQRACQKYTAECVSKINSILSIVCVIYGLCVLSLHNPLWMYDCEISTDHNQIGNINLSSLFNETMLCPLCLNTFFWICDMTRLLLRTAHVLVIYDPNIVPCHWHATSLVC